MAIKKELPQKAEVVIIGGGVIGCSIAYHLAEAGCTDIVLLEKDEIASKASSKAAGLITHIHWEESLIPFQKYGWSIWEKFHENDDVQLIRMPISCPVRENDPEELKEMMKLIPEVCTKAYGEEAARYIDDPDEIKKLLPGMSSEKIVLKCAAFCATTF